jgi:hypothetical protein
MAHVSLTRNYRTLSINKTELTDSVWTRRAVSWNTHSHVSLAAGFVTATTVAGSCRARQADRQVYLTTLATAKTTQRGCTWIKRQKVQHSYMGESERLKGVFFPKFPMGGLRHYMFRTVPTSFAYFLNFVLWPRWIHTELAFTLARNATKPNPFEIISLETTRKNNWKTEETLKRAILTLKTKRIKGSIPRCLWLCTTINKY